MPTDLAHYGSCTLNDTCPSCGEGAVPVRVLRCVGEVAEVEDQAGNRAEVALDFVSGVSVGDVLLVQSGVALGRAEA